MQEVFEKIIERLNSKKAYFQRFYECEGKSEHDADLNKSTQLAFDDAIEIVKQEAEQFGTDTNVGSNGWIPVSERLPKEFDTVLVAMADDCKGFSHKRGSLDIGYLYNRIGFCCACATYSIDDIIAWQPLPEPYEAKEE